MQERIYIPNMIIVGSTARNTGKTTFISSLIKKYKQSVIGLKVTTINSNNSSCPRGGEGCGVCSSLDGEYRIENELNINGNKDTNVMLKSGAVKVKWLISKKDYLRKGIEDFLQIQNVKQTPIICESNSLAGVVRPGLFVMLNAENETIKRSAKDVLKYVDLSSKEWGDIYKCVKYEQSRWSIV